MTINFSDKIPVYIKAVALEFGKNGYKCYLTGGAVRDIVMGIMPKDYDLATDAVPNEISKIFPKSITTNSKFGTVIILVEDDAGETTTVEVTTFRSEANYVDGRWPSHVEFTKDLHRDLGRRDFTINAMAINLLALDDGITKNDLIDLFNGQIDIDKRLIRAVGTPEERMLEDGLRSFKACRLAAELGFMIERNTYRAIEKTLSVASQISRERIRDEFVKMLMNSRKPSVGINLMKDLGLLKMFLPELLECIGILQPKEYHVHDVYNHILATMDVADDSVKLMALFHDIGKPICASDGHFYKHDIISSEIARDVMKRLKFSKSEIERVARIVRWHMFVYTDWRHKQFKIRRWNDATVRRFIKRIGGEEYIDDLFKLRIADAMGNPRAGFDPKEIHALEKRISEVLAMDMALKVTDLKIDGNDLIKIGIPVGPEIGKILNGLLDEVIENPALNTRKQLLRLVGKYR